MGVIRKQSISGSIYSYIGVALGFITTALFYPRIFSTEEVGLLRILVSYSTLFAQFAGLGFSAVTVKLFPYFRTKDEKHHGYFGLSLFVGLTGFVLAGAIYLLLRPNIIENAEGKSDLFVTYFYYVLPLILFTLLFNVFDTYYRVLYNAVKGIVVKEVIQRVSILAVILLFYFDLISFHYTVILYTLALISPTILLFISLVRNKKLTLKPDFSFIDSKLRKEMMSVGFFGMLSSYSGILVMNIDIIMVQRMVGLSAAGVYTVTFFFGLLVAIPARTMGKIGSVVVADAWKRNDIKQISSIYNRSSLSLSVVGLLIFIGIWGNIDNIFIILQDKYLAGKMVIFYIALGNLLEISLGISGQIILNSKYYRWLSYFLGIFAILIIISNWILIPIYGIIGAAMASFISKIIYSILKYVFVYKRLGMQPFVFKHLLLIIIGIVAYAISLLLPVLPHFIIDIIVRSTIITVAFGIPVYYFKISTDINDRTDSLIASLKKRL